MRAWENCPSCKADLRDAPIPQDLIDKGYYAAGSTHYLRTIGVYDPDLDCTVAWRCPDCGYEEAR
jgi:hypothetical protein